MGENILSQFGSRLGAYTEVALIPSDSLTSNSDILGHHRASLRQDFHALVPMPICIYLLLVSNRKINETIDELDPNGAISDCCPRLQIADCFVY
jgi:hypothetical protein